MGDDVALPIYGIKDQWASFIKHLVTVPDNRLSATVGHVHLDCVEKYLGKYSASPSDVAWALIIFIQLYRSQVL